MNNGEELPRSVLTAIIESMMDALASGYRELPKAATGTEDEQQPGWSERIPKKDAAE